MAPLRFARHRLFALCVAVAGHAAAFAAVSSQTLKLLQNGSFDAYRPGTLVAWLGLSAVPALILSPFIGPVAGSRWNRVVLVGTSAVVAAALAAGVLNPELPWLSVAGLLALELAVFGPAALTLAAHLGREAGLRPPTAALGFVLALVGGLGLGTLVAGDLGPRPAPATTALLFLVPAVAALAITGTERHRLADPVSLGQGIVRPFLDGARASIRHRRARHALVGLWLWSFVALAAGIALVRIGNTVDFRSASLSFWVTTAAGALVGGLNRHPYRHAGFVLYAALAAAGSVLCLRFWDTGIGPLIGLGFALGLALSPLLNFYLTWTSPKHHGVAAALIVAGWCAAALVLAVVLVNLGHDPAAARIPLLNILLAVTSLALVAGLVVFFRPALELTVEAILGPVYRIRAVGPGVEQLPARGPCLVIGNHGGWLDPLFVAKIVPVPITPMMTSKFYDLPGLAWLMRHVIGTIRVPDKTVRHEAPELKEAIAALDRGEYVVLFPEGYLRRKEEVPLRRFGRGIWQILNDRPETPLFACWIEGAWGSFLSHRGGPPATGKRPDLWRRIRIGVLGPIAADPAVLKDHMTTRTFLMARVAEARTPLGLEPLELPTTGEAAGDKE